MREFVLLARGLIAGLVIAAPPGPVTIACMQGALAAGWRSGLACGFGAAACDTLYGAVAAFSINIVITFLVRELIWIRLLGGILLVVAGFYYCCRPHAVLRAARHGPISTFLLNLSNPTVMLSFLAVLAALGLGGPRDWPLTIFVVSGVFCGSMLWWIALSVFVGRVRARIDERKLSRLDRIAGLAIGAFGAALILFSCATKWRVLHLR